MNCPKCNKTNDEDAIYCKYCGYLLKQEINTINTEKLIKINYLLSIILGWVGVPLTLISKSNHTFFIGAIGFILPLNLLTSKNKELKKHAIIQILICLTGIITQIILICTIK